MLDIGLVEVIFEQGVEEVWPRKKNALVSQYWIATLINQFNIAQWGIVQILSEEIWMTDL